MTREKRTVGLTSAAKAVLGKRKSGKAPVPRPRTKPEVHVVRMSDGSYRIVNANAAARWIGESQQAFSDAVRRLLEPPKSKHTVFARVKDKVLREFPELFC